MIIDDAYYLEKLKKKKIFPLHIHWDGSIPAEDIFEMARQRGIPLLLPERDIEGKPIRYSSHDQRVIKSPEQLRLFMTDLRKYDLVDVFKTTNQFMQTKEDLIATAIAHCNYLKSQNAPYAETRFAPQYHTFGGLSVDEVIRYAVEGFQKGKKLTGVDVRLIISIGREADAATGIRIADAAVAANKLYPDMVLGIDLACEERGNPPEKHLPAFRLTFDTPLKRTVHAGEMCDEQTNLHNVRTAIQELRADAIGHAIQLYKDAGLINFVKSRKIRIESNPLSNKLFFIDNIEQLHLNVLVNQGVLVTINPDDPAMIPEGDLVHNLYHLGKLYGDGFVDKVIRNSIEAAWGLTRQQKDKYLTENRL